ncbi:MAG: LOW QUALITY PROTEIN: hypothetical protein KVP17_002618 [Porospora cf. gigantea B]|uniref:uncharacterized protein n=1 Tax=Porospora cf. gigantea B TaxID=2853592 RepID=UPI003571E7C0|nr:MAG: LOW QUALITY PROTEIN: hypothetical protein KVP17_002618 [Porospora cf. gigantea B]
MTFLKGSLRRLRRSKKLLHLFIAYCLSIISVASCADLSAAGDLFSRDHKNLSVADRVVFAKNFIKAASEFESSEDYPQEIAKYASVLDTDATSLAGMLDLRAAAARNAGQSPEPYEKIAALVLDTTPELAQPDLEKLASLINHVDQKYGFDSPYHERRMLSAWDIVFQEKVAVEEDQGVSDKEDIVARFGVDALEAVELPDGTVDFDKLDRVTSIYGTPGKV